jgi:hypothetical protein
MAFYYLWEKKLLNKNALSEINNPEDWVSPKLRRVFDEGHMIHTLIQYGYLKDYGLDYRAEIPLTNLYKQYLIGGSVDLSIKKMQDNVERAWDIKTMRTEKFQKLDERDNSTIPKENLVQLNIYLFGLRFKHGGLLYWNKNDGELKEFLVNADYRIIESSLKRALLGKKFLSGDNISILSECLKYTGKFESCPFTSICFQTKNKNIIKLTDKKNNTELIK